jgi:DnaJ family protein C protein 25
LTARQVRAEYDFMRYNQEAYYQKYGASVLWAYAPKSDATFIVLFLILLANWLSWAAQKHRWQMVADRLIKAAVEDWSASQGGTPESKQLREEAVKILQEREQKQSEEAALLAQQTADSSNGGGVASPKPKKAKGVDKVSAKEKKRLEQESLLPIVTELVGKIDNFGAGFHKPTWKDLLLVKFAKFPYTLSLGIAWETKYYFHRLQKKELNEEERQVLTERAVGHVSWDLASEEEKATMVKQELWMKDKLAEWIDEQELKNMSKADKKYHAQMKKKEKGGKEL